MAKAKKTKRKTTRRKVDRETVAAEIVIDVIEDALGIYVPGMPTLKLVLPAVINVASTKGADVAIHHLIGLTTGMTEHFVALSGYGISGGQHHLDVAADLRTLAKREAIWLLIITLTKAVCETLERC